MRYKRMEIIQNDSDRVLERYSVVYATCRAHNPDSIIRELHMNNLNKSIVFLSVGISLMTLSLIINSQFHEDKIPPSNTAIAISTIPIGSSIFGLIGLIYLFNKDSDTIEQPLLESEKQ